MPIRSLVKPNLYKDSVALMRISESLSGIEGVRLATLMMGTAANKEILEEAGRLQPEVKQAGPDDIMVVLEADSDEILEDALARIDTLLAGGGAERREARESPARTLAMALARSPDANLVVISTPGQYAGAEALKALRHGRHVFMFSDNVPLEEEVSLKALARTKGLLVMGPDCGTAIVGGVPLGFANVVRRGAIGLVAAAGTGLQQVTCLIDRLGEGVSHAIGTGSRDLQDAVGGVTMQQGLEALLADEPTKVVVLVSKPPSPAVAAKVLEQGRGSRTPLVVLFLGGDPEAVRAAGAVPAVTLDEAASLAVALVRGEDPRTVKAAAAPAAELVQQHARQLAPGQRYMRGLFSGGTFCSEAQVVWRREGISAFSNVPLDKTLRLPDPNRSREHTAIDMGSDEFTVGRPHPMIDFRARVERLLREARDPAVAVVLLDVVLGYGAHEDPAAALAPAVREAQELARRDGRHLAVVGSVCGTQGDPQRLTVQEDRLREAGMVLAPSNAAASALAAAIATRGAAVGETRR